MQGNIKPVRDPEKVYVDNYTWLPISKVNARALRSALAYGEAPSEAKIIDTHVRVPRKFLPQSKLRRLGEVVVRTYNFPKHNVESKTTLRPYQVDPLNSMLQSKGGILNLGCGYGKTVLSLNFIARKGLKAAVVLGNTSLLAQWKGEINKHLEIDPERVGIVQGSNWQWEDHDIVLISLATLSRRAKDNRIPKGFCESFGVVIYDEAHHLSAPMFSKTCPLFPGERHGLTATPKREDGLEQVFINHLGPVHFSKVEQELIPTCLFVKTDLCAEERMELDRNSPKDSRVILDKAGEIHHRKLCSWIGTSEPRNKLIQKLASISVRSGRKTLCLTHSVDHAKHMHSITPNSGLAIGEVSSDLRCSVIKECDLTFATVDIAAEALDVPELACLIVMTSFGARTQGNLLQQALGRIQRRSEGKKDPIAIFMYDVNIPMMRGLGWQCRKKLYEWEYPVSEVTNNDTDRKTVEEFF